jgi:hypothetical protein
MILEICAAPSAIRSVAAMSTGWNSYLSPMGGGNRNQCADNQSEDAPGGLHCLLVMVLTIMMVLVVVVILIMMISILMTRRIAVIVVSPNEAARKQRRDCAQQNRQFQR